MTITINGTSGITTPEVTLDNAAADGGQVVLKSSGYSNWNLDNYSGRFRAYYGSTEYFTVDSSGNVGIGTSSPDSKLTISGYTGGSYNTAFNYGGQYNFIVQGTSGYTMFRKSDGTEMARIDSSGNLLVGTTSSGGVGFTFSPGSVGAPYIDINKSYNGNINGINFRYNGTYLGGITFNNSAVAYNTTSDYRLKENIQPMRGAIEKVVQLKPVTYTWKADGSSGQGFIAHELQEVCPDAVTWEKDAVDAEGNPVYQGIDTSFLVATLTAAIQELKAIVDEQAAKITALENK